MVTMDCLACANRQGLLEGGLTFGARPGREPPSYCAWLSMEEERMELTDKPLRILVADDHLVVRKGLRLLLEEMGEGFTLVGEAGGGEGAIRPAGELQPEVGLVDVRMPGMGGVEA